MLWGCLTPAKGRAAAASALGESQQQAGTSANSGLEQLQGNPLPKLWFWAVENPCSRVRKGARVAQQEAEHQDPTAKAPRTCADSEKCWELGVAGVCDMPHCYLGVKVLVPLPPRD